MNNLIEDLSIVTAIPEKILDKLMQAISYIICQDILEDSLSENTMTSIDCGFGTLYIKHDDTEPKFKFVPDDNLKEKVKGTIHKKLNLMEKNLSDKLSSKILDVYKDLC